MIIKSRVIPPPDVKAPHIVPRFLLNQFADGEKRFWKFRKDMPPKLTSTKSECTESFYYGKMEPQKGQQIESLLSGIENFGAKALTKLDRRDVVFDQQETLYFALFLATLFYRGRKARAYYTGNQLQPLIDQLDEDESLRNAQHELLKRGELVTLAEVRRLVGAYTDRMRSDPALLQFYKLEERTIELAVGLSKKRWTVVRAPEPSFITSDAPLFSMCVRPDAPAYLGTGMLRPETAVFLALSPHSMFIAGPDGSFWDRVASPDFIADVNRATVSYAEKAVYAVNKRTALQALADASLGSFQYVFPDYSAYRKSIANAA